jgi:hypothetical protein
MEAARLRRIGKDQTSIPSTAEEEGLPTPAKKEEAAAAKRRSTSLWSYFRDLDKYRGGVRSAVQRLMLKDGTKGIQRSAFVRVVEEVLPIRDDVQRAYVEAMVHLEGTGLLKEDSVLRHLDMCRWAEQEAADPNKKDTVLMTAMHALINKAKSTHSTVSTLFDKFAKGTCVHGAFTPRHQALPHPYMPSACSTSLIRHTDASGMHTKALGPRPCKRVHLVACPLGLFARVASHGLGHGGGCSRCNSQGLTRNGEVVACGGCCCVGAAGT